MRKWLKEEDAYFQVNACADTNFYAARAKKLYSLKLKGKKGLRFSAALSIISGEFKNEILSQSVFCWFSFSKRHRLVTTGRRLVF